MQIWAISRDCGEADCLFQHREKQTAVLDDPQSQRLRRVIGQQLATMQTYRAYLLQPVSLLRSELGRVLLQRIKQWRRVATRDDRLA